MRAVMTVIGKDTVGILAKVSAVCSERNVNINEVTQTVMQELFCMIMMCDISNINVAFDAFADEMGALGSANNLKINVMHENIFTAMHTI